MPLKIIRNDITKVTADAIVNTANPLPRIGAGTDRAIHQAAGPELLEARRQIGPIAVGSCAATPAFRLNASYVLHTVSPGWEGGGKGEAETLRRAYDAALETADALGCKSVAFPLLAAGSYGFPHDLALSVAIRAFTDFLLVKRLNAAVNHLIRSNKSIRDIARLSGFGSVATFNRVFREQKNCTPTQFRAIYGTAVPQDPNRRIF